MYVRVVKLIIMNCNGNSVKEVEAVENHLGLSHVTALISHPHCNCVPMSAIYIDFY